MVLDSLLRGVALLGRDPLLWLPGLVAGCFGALDILLQFFFGAFITTRLWFLEALTIPFFIACAYARIRTGGGGAREFLAGGLPYYFRVLLPMLVIGFAILATIILVIVPLAILGAVNAALPFAVIGTSVPIAFFSFFFDTAAVFEDRGVFDCIRRSVELVLGRPGRVIGFFLVCIGVLALVAIPLAVIWTGILYDRLLPIAALDPGQIQTISMAMLNNLLGLQGIVLTAIVYLVGVTLAGSIICVYKAVFYQAASAGAAPAAHHLPTGEYDEKGRWYKY